ncbi:MAG TPA: HAMP domain-containing sensor histidine kinase, partial [Acidimicrobiales bacterium]
LHELTALTGELVDLASDQKGAEEPVEVALADVAQEIAQRARRRSGREVDVEVDEPAIVLVRKGQLERSIGNLVDNALKFAPEGPVVIKVRGATVEVLDHGPGIAPVDRARVFDRFYRADAARTLPGSGLGLAMVQQFADDHGARTSVGEAPWGGAVVGIDLSPCKVSVAPGWEPVS